jgi:hypothetical protein
VSAVGGPDSSARFDLLGATMAKIARTNCETCGVPHPSPWFTLHRGKGTLRLCADCTADALGRLEAEGDQLREELEAAWRLPAHRVGRADDVDDAAP